MSGAIIATYGSAAEVSQKKICPPPPNDHRGERKNKTATFFVRLPDLGIIHGNVRKAGAAASGCEEPH